MVLHRWSARGAIVRHCRCGCAVPKLGFPNWRPGLKCVWVKSPASGVLTTVETELKYAGYIAQQERQIARLRDSESRRIPAQFSYDLPGLSTEVRHKLTRVRPETLGQAGRIPGVTPAAVAVLDVYLSIAR